MKRLCITPGCPDPVVHRGYCKTHSRQHEAQRSRQFTRVGRKLYHSKRWEILRRHVLFEQPLCLWCGRVAVDVDHIEALADGGDPWKRDNLQGLCRSCHAAKSRREQERRR